MARAQVASAEAALKLEQTLRDQHVLRSPIAGSVAALDLRVGMHISGG